MTKSRLGKTDSIFKKTESAKEGMSKTQPIMNIRPTAGTSIENKLTVILPPSQVDFLDRLALEIRSKTTMKVRRTEIIRALIAGLMGSGLDLSVLGTEEDIAAHIRDRLRS